MNILFAAAECSPFAKVGGLGDVVGSLPKALLELGVDARIILPRYKTIDANLGKVVGKISVEFGGQTIPVTVRQTTLPNSKVVLYLLDEHKIFGHAAVYERTDAAPGSASEVEKFLFFDQCVAEFCRQKIWVADLLHAHDWHTALIPLLMKIHKSPIPCLLTIHNLAMQGVVDSQTIKTAADEALEQDSVKADLSKTKKINLLRQGLIHASAVSTVSPTYALEILTEEYGEGLQADLKKLPRVSGILNGIDQTVWNQTSDPFIAKHYDSFSGDLKLQNKLLLQRQLGLTESLQTPLVGVVSRLTGQKGFDLLEPIASELEILDFQMIILGVGEPKIEEYFAGLQQKYPERFIFQKKFDERLAHQIYAASDIFLMPSRFEPCGLGQMIAMRYGSLPLVRATGGLKDSVVNLRDDGSNADTATGFGFNDYNPQQLLEQLRRALALYRQNPATWQQLVHNAMSADCSWTNSAKQYSDLYRQILESSA